MRTAKLFRTGGSQAVRLPAEFRFDGDEVAIRRDPETGDVILSPTVSPAKTWEELLARIAELGGAPDDFLVDRGQRPPQERESLNW